MGRYLSSGHVVSVLPFFLWRASALCADPTPSHTDWERGRVKAVSREAGARKRAP